MLEEHGEVSYRQVGPARIYYAVTSKEWNMSANDRVGTEQIMKDAPIENIREDLIEWWKSKGKRQFPWRETQDPFNVLVAEIILHRTRADQVVPLYRRFLEDYPNVNSIAASSSEELERKFHSAGLHWRWKLLQSMAVDVITKFNGQIPHSFEELTSLPGVSHYIASAVRCFAFGYPDALLDTNTVRVAGRIFGLPVSDSSRRSKLYREVLELFVDTCHPREFNFAIIDFAAAVCKPKTPVHHACPIREYCRFYLEALKRAQRPKTDAEMEIG